MLRNLLFSLTIWILIKTINSTISNNNRELIRLIDHEHLIHDADSRVLKLKNVFNHTTIEVKVSRISSDWILPVDFCIKHDQANGFDRITFAMKVDCQANYTNAYRNEDAGTILLVTHQPSQPVLVYGVINDNLLISPVWKSKSNHYQNGSLHMIIRIHKPLSEFMGFNVANVLANIVKAHKQNNLNTQRGTIYPEVTLVVDQLAFEEHLKSSTQLWHYFIIYFHYLELIYKQLPFPAIRIRLKEILYNKNFAFQKYIPRKSVEKSNRRLLNALGAIDELGFEFYELKFNSDIIFTVTGFDLCKDVHHELFTCRYSSIKGESMIGGACKQDAGHRRKLNIAIVEDYGNFEGVLVGAHEIGHLLGSVHDGQWPVKGILGPGGVGCGSTGHLMGGIRKSSDPKKITWSVCSREQFEYFIRLPESICLYNRPLK